MTAKEIYTSTKHKLATATAMKLKYKDNTYQIQKDNS